jgi:hypothetical protein
MIGITLSEEEHRRRMRKRAEAVIKHYPIGTDAEADAKPWAPGMMDSRLLADEVMLYLTRDQAPEFCEWKRDGAWLRSPHGRMSAMAYGLSAVEPPKYCQDCGRRIKESK